VWFPYVAPFYVARIGEMRPVMIVLAAVITIAILIWRKPERYALWIAEDQGNRTNNDSEKS
jgi:hypothetical protein